MEETSERSSSASLLREENWPQDACWRRESSGWRRRRSISARSETLRVPGVQGRAAISTRRVAFRGFPQGGCDRRCAGKLCTVASLQLGTARALSFEETLQIRDSVREAINDMEVSTRDLPLLAGMAL